MTGTGNEEQAVVAGSSGPMAEVKPESVEKFDREAALAEALTGVVTFEVKGIGKFAGRRLTATQHLDVMAEQAMVLEQHLERLRKKNSLADQLTASTLPFEMRMNVYYMAFLKAAEVTPSSDVHKALWDGAEASDPDVVSAVYHAYHAAKSRIFATEDEVVDDLKN